MLILRRQVVRVGLTLLGVAFLTSCSGDSGTDGRVLLATTTSTADSGLLDALLPKFEAETGFHVDFVAVGSGAALEHGKNGDVDVVLVHAPESEEAFVRAGFGLARVPVMYNDFVVVGPATDPAGVRGSVGAADAFRKIAARGASFVSRGDRSGTHVKEQAIWLLAETTPEGSWYIEAGQGMGACLLMASEKLAYTLTDRGTFLARRGILDLEILFEGGDDLENPYSIIAVQPDRRSGGNHQGALRLIEWMTSPGGQRSIADFRVNGEILFHPNVEGETP